MSNDRGRLPLSRKVIKHWTWKHPLLRGAWIWLLVTAAYANHNGLKRGQLRFSITQGEEVFGMSTSQTRRFLTKLSTPGPWNNWKPEITWSKGARGGAWGKSKHGNPKGNPDEQPDGRPGGSSPGIITLLNYDYYNPRGGKCEQPDEHPKGNPDEQPDEHLLELKKESKKERKKEHTASDEAAPVSENSQIYNLYIETRRKAIDRPDWLPTETQAKTMRANIKKLLKSYGVEELLVMLRNYFEDTEPGKKKWPWTFFTSDPIRWAGEGRKSYQDELEGY